MLDEILGMKACKASIKAGQRLNILEMQKLMQDGIEHIEGMFVCQHGRPSVVKIPRGDVDGLFDR
jgi:DNA mismatch repair ATPase MutL